MSKNNENKKINLVKIINNMFGTAVILKKGDELFYGEHAETKVIEGIPLAVQNALGISGKIIHFVTSGIGKNALTIMNANIEDYKTQVASNHQEGNYAVAEAYIKACNQFYEQKNKII